MQKSTLTNIAMASGPSIHPEKKEIQLQKEAVQLADGSTMKPLKVRNADDGLKATLLILFKHVADMHISVLEIISEKFGLDIDEMHLAIKDHPKWIQMFDNPLVSDLTFDAFENSEKKKTPAPAPATATAPAPTTSVATPPSSPKSSGSGKKAGRPKMTEEQKAAAKAKREAAKKAPAPAAPTPAPTPAPASETKTPAPAPAPAPASAAPTSESWICGHCHVGPGNDHRLCICKGYNYDADAWEKARIFTDDDFIIEDTPVPAPPPKRKLKK